ncbi:DEKNAAC104338 [Brettanomyces naardenensis]|uniref:DEKNAAC104338 n=1 Tax=Brettanomyces naardenensis TaxID=13370 RepID=A0A448YQL9_BRENA|nr:DEKNAAC104338 [Brettanomyces naardenensis]
MHVQGTCDLFTTKPIGIDRKLYKRLDRRYSSSRHSSITGEDELAEEDGKARSNSDTGVLRKRRRPLSGEEEEDSAVADDYPVDEEPSSDQFVSPEFIQLKKRSSSYSYPHRRPQISQTNGITRSRDGHYDSISKPRSKSFHYSMTRDSGDALAALRGNRDTETLDYYSPFGPLSQQSSRRLFAYLIAILNSTYPDHDFSLVQPNNFSLLTSPEVLIKRVNSLLISLGKASGLDWIWQTIDTHMEIGQCTCFQYEPEQSFLNDLPGTLWCNMYFMYSKKKKRVAFIYFRASTLQESKNGSATDVTVTARRRNSKVGTLDEARDDETQEEYDLRYSSSPISEDVFEEEEEEEDRGEEETADEGKGNKEEESVSPLEKIGDSEEDEEDYEGGDYAMDEEELANENQDDEDDFGNGNERSEGMEVD